MAVIEVGDVQAWLEQTKMSVSVIDVELEQTFRLQVFGALNVAGFDTSTWVDPATTPALVKNIIAGYVAGWSYNRQYSESIEPGQRTYGDRIIALCDSLLAQLVSGAITVDDIPNLSVASSGPAFYPADTTSYEQQYDGAGHAVGDAYGSDIKFRMAERF